MIVIGSLVLLVLLIVGGILVFSGSDLFSGFSSVSASDTQLAMNNFINHCRSQCQTLNLRLTWKQIYESPEIFFREVKGYCCESQDLDLSGGIDYYGAYGPEICSLAYDCKLGVQPASVFCEGLYPMGDYFYSYKYKWIGPRRVAGDYFCDLNPVGYVSQGSGVQLG